MAVSQHKLPAVPHYKLAQSYYSKQQVQYISCGFPLLHCNWFPRFHFHFSHQLTIRLHITLTQTFQKLINSFLTHNWPIPIFHENPLTILSYPVQQHTKNKQTTVTTVPLTKVARVIATFAHYDYVAGLISVLWPTSLPPSQTTTQTILGLRYWGLSTEMTTSITKG